MNNLFFNVTCAIVGSSSEILEHSNGILIDKHDIVIRSNYAPTYMYEKYVGNKTDAIVVPYHMYKKGKCKKYNFYSCDSHFAYPACLRFRSQCSNSYLINPSFSLSIRNIVGEKMPNRPTTGFTSIFLANSLCREIKLFGFGETLKFNYSKYYDKTKKKYIKYPHDYYSEKRIIKNKYFKVIEKNYSKVVTPIITKN
tara:strand:+ start:5360 stop:5950 length:591 start_codon:yes stop_codon:yes gene_type:complete